MRLMSVSVVNGFLCFSGCDAAKARKGEDPRERANLAEPAAVKERDKSPAAEFARASAETITANVVDPAHDSRATDSPGARRTGQSVDLFV
jgi:hypothetical protein